MGTAGGSGYGEFVATRDIYGGRDPREVPFYGVTQVASYLKMAPSTLRPWIVGQPYLESQNRAGAFSPMIISPAAVDPVRLSFNNLVELYVIATLRREHGLNLTAIRKAIANVRKATGSKRPLLTKEFATDGVRIYLDEAELLEVSTGEGRQFAMREIVQKLKRVERDKGEAVRLYLDREHRIVADPLRSFGKATVKNTRITIEAIASFRAAGEKIADIAEEFSLPVETVKGALQWFDGPRLAA